jgi:SAM-dependent methyltransferase
MNDATHRELPRARRLAVHTSEVLDRFGLAEPAFRVYQRLKGRGAQPDQAPDGLPLPPAQLRFKVIGNSDPQVFLNTGETQAAVLREHLAPALVPAPKRLLDFGVGCGRVARHWHALGDGVEVHGTDYNPRLVEWVQANLPFVQAARNGLEPPLRYPDGHFDAIYAISLFTHWPADLQVAWMHELRRVMAPGGRLVITTHGEGLVEHMLTEERERFAAGELVVRNIRSPGSNLCVTYHPPAWVRAHLLAGFDELVWTPTAPAFTQDVWVLERV